VKIAILITSSLAAVLLIVGYVAAGVAIASIASQCPGFTDPNFQQCIQSHTTGSAAAGAALGLLLIGVGGIVTGASWLLAVIKTVMIGRWGWFAAVLIVPVLGSLIYGIAGPNEKAA
jgi:hypothetical protein